MTIDLQAPADELARVAVGVRDDQLAGPTPCTESDVATILAHVSGLAIAFRDAARKVDGPTTSTPPTDAVPSLSDGWREEIPRQLDELAQAWREPGAVEGMTTAGGVTMPAAVMHVVANNELVLHAWDLARATGQTFHVAPANLEASWEMVSGTPDTPEARAGLFGPVVPVPDDAPLLDRVLGGSGRHPDWSPATAP